MFEIKKEDFAKREERILAFWKRHKVFAKSIEPSPKKPLFSFYDGPPFATGLPHYGHILAGTIKDVIPRYKTMKGFHVPRRFGWDCHGLPVENEIEKAQELSGAPAIEEFGISKFNEECRSIVLRYTEEWEKTVKRMGRWVDFERTYKTMDPSYMESVWWVFGELWDKGLVYEGFKVMPFSAKLGTPLSNFEANLNYREVDDPSLFVLFSLLGEENTFLLAWTTTPWTLPSNLALIVNKELDYVKVKEKKSGRFYILGKKAFSRVLPEQEEYEVVERFKGGKLKGRRYQPLFPYFQEQKGAFQVLLDSFVEEEEGTGVVHCAPAFGEADFFICTREGIELVCPIDQNGKFTEEVPDYQGLFVKDADKEIIRRLKREGKVFSHQQVRHRYPFCWRSDTPLIYKAVHTWFVSVEKIKDKLIAANQKIHWVPSHVKEGRFGKWLESARDWAISRNRYWGTPIPLWRSPEGKIVVIRSKGELEKKTGHHVKDLHRHHIDHLSFKEKGVLYQRIPEVFDCWFESGAMPYAQNHYPFQKVEETLKSFPADFIAEGLDQTRGWFYTLMVLSVSLFNQPAFKNAIVNGILLAEDGAKMSKKLKNYPEPEEVINLYGADAVRLYLLHSPAVVAEDLAFAKRGVELVLRQILIPFWNSFVFLATYANIYEWKPKKEKFHVKNDMDRWILSLTNRLISNVEKGLESYNLAEAVTPFVSFIENLTNWYIRRSRSRFWADEESEDRSEAFETLYFVLLTVTKIAAPFLPFLSEAIYLELKGREDPESVHLCFFPKEDPLFQDSPLERQMELVQLAVSMGHALRKEHKVRVRQPLSRADLICRNAEKMALLKKQKQLILDELNVKEVVFHEEESSFVTLEVKPNFPVLGKKVGPLMRKVQEAISALGTSSVEKLLTGQKLVIHVEGQAISLTDAEVIIERKVKESVIALTENEITIALNTTLTSALFVEGLARECVNKINMQRRNEGLEVTDRIFLTIESTPLVEECFEKHGHYIMHEVLAKEVLFDKTEGTEWDLAGEKAIISIKRVT